MRKKHKRKSGSKWLAAVAVALLAAAAWNAYRTPAGTSPVGMGETAIGESASTDGARTTRALELPPPPTENATPTPSAARYPAFLPAEAIDTLRLIEQRGPYPYRQDDGLFGNREGRLPRQPRGYYREYTVETPGSPDRGARRIIAGGQPPIEYFYTADHYGSFRRFTLDDGRLDDDRTPAR
jgi:guanyl-specific ribonuclease Sa